MLTKKVPPKERSDEGGRNSSNRSNLSGSELDFLHYMLRKKRITPSRTQPIELITRDVGRKIKNLKRVIQSLKNRGLLGEKPKKKSRRTFWIDPGETKRILREHGRI